MTTTQQDASGGGLLPKLVILVLLAVTFGFYLKIVMSDGPATVGSTPPQASIQVVEGRGPGKEASTGGLKAMPEDQLVLIKQVFAPELGEN